MEAWWMDKGVPKLPDVISHHYPGGIWASERRVGCHNGIPFTNFLKDLAPGTSTLAGVSWKTRAKKKKNGVSWKTKAKKKKKNLIDALFLREKKWTSTRTCKQLIKTNGSNTILCTFITLNASIIGRNWVIASLIYQ